MNETESMNIILDFYKDLQFVSPEKRQVFFQALVGMKVPELVMTAYEWGYQDGIEQEQAEHPQVRGRVH